MISNTSPLINLGKADALNLIPLLFSNDEFDVIIPMEVMEEIKSPLKKQIMEMQENGQVIISPPFMDTVMNNVRLIAEEIAINANKYDPEQHYAEAYVIVKGEIAKTSLGSAFVLIDEKAAKTIAKKKGLRTMTHVNIIEACVNEGMLPSTKGLEILEKLISEGVNYRSGMLEHYRMIWS